MKISRDGEFFKRALTRKEAYRPIPQRVGGYVERKAHLILLDIF
jgi:hypothetical protein